ncbi:carbohydrate ABC transporter permease [Cohnella sp. LGH]|uniref:Carbohydrate ABC transporter membrane protein 2 (CUT1 family) n=1 Tax=Cohnella phaseoli TaxID=456490 RepID=A0A3D9KD64_9BACL|nr:MULTISPECIES: carbohydrate ABC transporter permease [Cohnella]QTH46238.1 carbohydrate ABC transporter permease [Cohnella sp. LGH]RED84348.1 carbohydrate ABC transporter membrane protein 2 (CUT1 family) [Cohnella phaseoli]
MPKVIKKALPHLLLLIYVFIILFPFVFVLFSSLKESNDQIVTAPFGFPVQMAFDNYVDAWTQAKISKYFFNSAYLSVSAAVSAILIAAATAYALSRMRFDKSSKAIYQFILIGMLIPGNVLFIAQYILIQKLGLLDTHWALYLPYTAGALPFSVLLIVAFMKAIPSELEEAAIVDGLGVIRSFIRIILPLTMPALVTVFIINLLGNWNEYLLANFFISKDALKTLPTGMVGFRDAFQTSYPLVFTGVVISVLPILVIYAFLQRTIIEGLTAGSVKG